MSAPSLIRFSDCELDLGSYELRRSGQPQPIEPQVLELLAYLARNPGRMIGKDELIQQVWGGRNVSDAALSSRIKSARRAIGDDGEQQRLIRTVHGRGFRFVGGIAPGLAPASPEATPAQPLVARVRVLTRTAPMVGAGLLVAVFAAVSWVLWNPFAPSSSPSSPLALAAHPVTPAPSLSIAVLPFSSFPAEADTRGRADALLDAITTRLSRHGDLFVVSRGASAAYGGRPVEPHAVGRELNVRYVASGSVRRNADDILVDVQLVEIESGRELWAERLVYTPGDRDRTVDRIAAQIVQSLNTKLVAAESRRSRREQPDSPGAADLTIRGSALLNKRLSPEVNAQALRLFEAAVALDGDSVSALLGLARTNLNQAVNQWSPPDERNARLDRAESALQRAIALAPGLSFAQRIRGGLLRARGEPEQAIAAFVRAIELDPDDAQAHAELGRVKIDIGLAAETASDIERALLISPRDREIAFWYFWAGQAAIHVGDGEAAVAWLRKAVEANPDYPNPLPWFAVAYAMLGRDDEARRYLDQFLRVRPGLTISGWDAAYRRRHPIVLAQLERAYTVLRRLDVPD